MEDYLLENIDLTNLNFIKTKPSCKNDIENYIITYSVNNKKILFKLENILIPFGIEIEPFKNKPIVNLEINPTLSNKHYNSFVYFSTFDESFKNNVDTIDNLKKFPFFMNIINKQFNSNIKKSKIVNCHIIRACLTNSTKIFTLINNYEVLLTSNDTKNTNCNVLLELNLLWISDDMYGLLWLVKEIQVNHTITNNSNSSNSNKGKKKK